MSIPLNRAESMPHNSQRHSLAQVEPILVWRHIFAGLSASLVSIGLARFAFTPLIPELIRAHWFSASAVIYLGAANLAGYLGGALAARPLAARLRKHTLRLMMLVITLAFFACAAPLSFVWYFGWRFISGMAGGVVMVLVAGTILPHVPQARRGIAGGAIFLGLGLGIAGSGTIVPLLLKFGLSQTWLGLGVVSAIITVASWFAWPSRESGAGTATKPFETGDYSHVSLHIGILYVQYALMAIAAVPPMVFLIDFITRGLGAGDLYWRLVLDPVWRRSCRRSAPVRLSCGSHRPAPDGQAGGVDPGGRATRRLCDKQSARARRPDYRNRDLRARNCSACACARPRVDPPQCPPAKYRLEPGSDSFSRGDGGGGLRVLCTAQHQRGQSPPAVPDRRFAPVGGPSDRSGV